MSHADGYFDLSVVVPLELEQISGDFSGTSRNGDMQPLPMDRNPGAVRGVHVRKFHKTVVQWGR